MSYLFFNGYHLVVLDQYSIIYIIIRWIAKIYCMCPYIYIYLFKSMDGTYISTTDQCLFLGPWDLNSCFADHCGCDQAIKLHELGSQVFGWHGKGCILLPPTSLLMSTFVYICRPNKLWFQPNCTLNDICIELHRLRFTNQRFLIFFALVFARIFTFSIVVSYIFIIHFHLLVVIN